MVGTTEDAGHHDIIRRDDSPTLAYPVFTHTPNM
jgi:hypothetical protein